MSYQIQRAQLGICGTLAGVMQQRLPQRITVATIYLVVLVLALPIPTLYQVQAVG
jgi:hypothetical protein